MGSTAALLTGLKSFDSTWDASDAQLSGLPEPSTVEEPDSSPALLTENRRPAGAPVKLVLSGGGVGQGGKGKEVERTRGVLGDRKGGAARGRVGEGRLGGGGGKQQMSLREQEQVVAELQKANFDLRLKIVFYEQRLSALSPQEIDQALRKHIQLQVTHETTKVELSRFKRLVAEGDQVVAKLRGEREAGEARERVLEEEVRGARRAEGEKEKTRVRLERKEKELEELRGRGRVGSAAPTDEGEINRLRDALEAEQAASEEHKGDIEDLRHELRTTTDLLEEAHAEIAQMKEAASTINLSSTERDELLQRVKELEDEIAGLGQRVAELETENDECRDRASSQALEVEKLEQELDRREQEVEDLVRDLDLQEADHALALERCHEDRQRAEGEVVVRNDVEARDKMIEGLMQQLAGKDSQLLARGEEATLRAADMRRLTALEKESEAKDVRLADLSTRTATTERRLAATQAQLARAEEKLEEARTKVALAEGKWEGKLRELQLRLLATEEKLRRERQGARARLSELGETITSLEVQVKDARRRDVQLGELVEASFDENDVD